MAHAQFTKEQLTESFDFSARHRNIAFGLIGVGIVLVLVGLLFGSSPDTHAEPGEGDHAVTTEQMEVHPVSDKQDHGDEEHGDGHGSHTITTAHRASANFLLGNVYFLTLAIGALFFLAIHQVGNAGWHTAIRRVPEAMTGYLPIAAIGFLILLFLQDYIFEWSWLPIGEDDLIDTKRGYLNSGFLAVRTIVFFGIWAGAAYLLRRLSVREDLEGGLNFFHRSTTISAIFIILFALSFTLFAVDWLMSMEPHWFSTIFGVYIFAGSMQAGLAVLALLMYFLKRQGYMKWVNASHFHDVNKYVFGFSIFWGYIWVSQFLLIWYSNIPEEGFYFVERYRVNDHSYLGYAFFFYVNIFLNFVIPFLGLMTRNGKRNPAVFVPILSVVLLGHWVDIFQLIMPGIVKDQWHTGLLELGFFLAIAGVFLYVVFRALSKANLVPLQHPYLEESLHHTTGPV